MQITNTDLERTATRPLKLKVGCAMKRRTIVVLLLLAGVLLAFLPSAATASTSEPASTTMLPVVVVMGFVDRSEGHHEHEWVGEALSALITSDLSESRSLVVADREHLRRHYEEMILSDMGLITARSASTFGNIAKASHVVFGTYAVAVDTIVIDVNVIDLAKESVIARVEAHGRADEVLDLEASLVLQILAKLCVDVSEREQAKILSVETLSLEAAQSYYLGLNSVRGGELEVALGYMLSAIHSDPHYAEPYSELMAIYKALGLVEHAEVARQEFLSRFSEHSLSFRELYRNADTLRRENRMADAVAIYRHIKDHSVDIHAAGAWIALGEWGGEPGMSQGDCFRQALRIRPDVGLFKLKAARELDRMGQMDIELARELCFSPILAVREIAYSNLASRGDEFGLRVMHKAFLSSRKYVHAERAAIGQALLDSRIKAEWDFLIQAALDGYGAISITRNLCHTFVAERYEPGLDVLGELLATMADKERMWAVQTLSRWDHPKVRAAIRNTLRDRNQQKSLRSACEAVVRLGDKQAIPYLEALLDHPYYQKQTQTYEVRKAAYEALLALGRHPSKPPLRSVGFVEPTLTGTSMDHGIKRYHLPTVACIGSQQNADGVDVTDGPDSYGYRYQLHNYRFLEQAGYRTLMYYNPWSDRQDARFTSEMEECWGYDGPILSAAAVDDLILSDCALVSMMYNVEPAVVRALERYVHGGGGLVVVDGFGMVNPNCIPEYYQLMGFRDGNRMGNGHPVTDGVNLTKVAEHPVLAGMPFGRPMLYSHDFKRAGAFGDGMFRESEHDVILNSDSPSGVAAVVREYGKGRIIIINWHLMCGRRPSKVGHLLLPEFYMRAIDWAGRMSEKYVETSPALNTGKLAPSSAKWLQKHNERWAKQADRVSAAPIRVDVAAEHASTSGPTGTVQTIAVLPFLNLSHDPRFAPLAESMAPVLGSLFEKAAGIVQVDREDLDKILSESSDALSGLQDEHDAIHLGALLGARYILIPSATKRGDKILLAARVQDVETTEVVAIAKAEGRIDDMLVPMKAMAASLAKRMGSRVKSVPLPVDDTPLANLHYMKGVGFRCSGDLGRALAELTIACRYSSSHTGARRMLARVYKELGFDKHARIVTHAGS